MVLYTGFQREYRKHTAAIVESHVRTLFYPLTHPTGTHRSPPFRPEEVTVAVLIKSAEDHKHVFEHARAPVALLAALRAIDIRDVLVRDEAFYSVAAGYPGFESFHPQFTSLARGGLLIEELEHKRGALFQFAMRMRLDLLFDQAVARIAQLPFWSVPKTSAAPRFLALSKSRLPLVSMVADRIGRTAVSVR